MTHEIWQEIDLLWQKLYGLQQQLEAAPATPPRSDSPASTIRPLLERIERLEQLFAERLGTTPSQSPSASPATEPTLNELSR